MAIQYFVRLQVPMQASVVYCNSPPGNSAELDYVITKLPAHVVTSTTSSSLSVFSPPFASLQEDR